ncbi:MAG: GNAT family N-acetyltransferase [Actinomycetota bacterium]|nr:GNAT family N-acetyltransferase [Actinomycetota bacterium]
MRAALPERIPRSFIVHMLSPPYPPGAPLAPGVVVSAPLDPVVLDGLPEDVRADALNAPAAAVRFVNEAPVAVCAVSDLTESLWDVGIDTVEPARRQGHGTAVFRALATEMAAQGRQPVWAAYEDDAPSLGMAARLGFRPVARMVALVPPARG